MTRQRGHGEGGGGKRRGDGWWERAFVWRRGREKKWAAPRKRIRGSRRGSTEARRMELEEDSQSGSLGWKEGTRGKFPVAATYWFCPTDSRLLGCLPHKPNSPLCGMSRGPYMGTQFPHRSPLFVFFSFFSFFVLLPLEWAMTRCRVAWRALSVDPCVAPHTLGRQSE